MLHRNNKAIRTYKNIFTIDCYKTLHVYDALHWAGNFVFPPHSLCWQDPLQDSRSTATLTKDKVVDE